MARPAGIEPAAPRLGVRRIKAAGDIPEPLPLILLAFCHTPNHPKPPRAATDCHPFVTQAPSRLRVLTVNTVSLAAELDIGFHKPETEGDHDV